MPDTIPSAYRTVEGEFHGATVELNADIEVSWDFIVYHSTSNYLTLDLAHRLDIQNHVSRVEGN